MTRALLQSIPRRVVVLLVLAGCVRLIVAFAFVDLGNKQYWEYGEVARNILDGRGYSLFYFVDNRLEHVYDPAVTPFPSAYMSPGYVAFLLPFLAISQDAARNLSLIFVQTCLSLLSMLLLYGFTAKAFSERTAAIALTLAAFLPDFVYAAVSFTPTVMFHCSLLGLMIVLSDETLFPPGKRVLVLSLLFGVLSYLRFEVLLFVALALLVLLAGGRWREILAVTAIVILLLCPWVIRSSLALNAFVPTGTGFGLNLYRGNNPDEIGSWGAAGFSEKIVALPRDRSFEVSLSRLYVSEVVSYVRDQPGRAVLELPVKLYQLWVFSPVGNRSPMISQITSWLLLILFLVGFFSRLSWQQYRYLYLFLLFSTVIALIFFTLPRHQTMMRIAVLPFAACGVEVFWRQAKKIKSLPGR